MSRLLERLSAVIEGSTYPSTSGRRGGRPLASNSEVEHQAKPGV
jgi:hypothetical protein